jgi:phage tail-like protein
MLSIPLLIAPSIRETPPTALNFTMEVNGKFTSYFTSAEGIGSTSQIVEHKVMSQNGQEVIQKIPGRLSWNAITLTRGLTANMDLATWRKAVEDGNVAGARSNGSISMLDRTGQVIATWEFTNAWPSELYQGEEEKVVIVVESINRVK